MMLMHMLHAGTSWCEPPSRIGHAYRHEIHPKKIPKGIISKVCMLMAHVWKSPIKL